MGFTYKVVSTTCSIGSVSTILMIGDNINSNIFSIAHTCDRANTCVTLMFPGGGTDSFPTRQAMGFPPPLSPIGPATSAMGTFPLSSILGSALSLGFYDTLCRTSPPFLFLLYPLMSGLEDSPGQSLARRNHASM